MLLSEGAIAPIALSDASPSQWQTNYYPDGGLGLTNLFASYGEIYKRQLWVAVLVNKVAMGAARLPFKVYQKGAAGRTDAAGTPFGRLMASPNPRHDPFFFWLWTVSTFEVYGEAMWLKLRARPGRPPVELWPLHPSNVYTHRNDAEDERNGYGPEGTLSYIFHIGGANVPVLRFPEADVVHFRSYSPDSQVRGMSRLEPLRQTILNEDSARRATSSMWNRGMRPGYVFTHPGELSDAAHRRLRAQLHHQAGGADRVGATLLLEEGMQAAKADLTAEEAQYVETRKLNREEACAAFDVPPPVVHILDRATFSNITEQMRSMYRDTMAPRLGLYESALHAQLTPDFGDDSLYAEFLMDEVMRGSFEARMAAYKDSIGFGIQTPGEIRGLENLPDLGPDTHRLYINSTMIPLGSAAGADASGAEIVVRPQITKSLDAASVRTVMGRLSRVKALAEVDPDHLTAGLNGDTSTVLALLDAAQMADDSVPAFRDRLRAAAKEDQ